MFAAAGDFAATTTTQVGWWRKSGEWVTAGCNLTFTTNAYKTAAGDFQITGLPFTAANSGNNGTWRNALGRHENISATVADIAATIEPGHSHFVLLSSVASGISTMLGVPNFPASTSGLTVDFQIAFRIVET